MRKPFIPALDPRQEEPGQGLWVIFRGQNVLTRRDPKTERVEALPLAADPAELGLKTVTRHFLGWLDGRPCWVAETEGDFEPEGHAFGSMRGLFYTNDEDMFGLAGRALGILDWDRNNRFCGRCGAAMSIREEERAKRCPECGLTKFPRLSPAVIVLVSREHEGRREMLLARSPRFPKEMFSTLAGFVEPGETLEECVFREIKEEVGIEVKDVYYFGSQHWPMPDSLMIGFTAAWAKGDIKVDGNEIVEAHWFSKDNLPPQLPGKMSIARALVEDFLKE